MDKLPPLELNEYEITWSQDTLGLNFGENEDLLPAVTKISAQAPANIAKRVSTGDILLYVNALSSSGMTFQDFFTELSSIPKPVTLRFATVTRLSRHRSPTFSGFSRASFTNRLSRRNSEDLGSRSSTLSNGSSSATPNRFNNLMNKFVRPRVRSSSKTLRPTAMALKEEEVYTVLWTEGQLGLYFGQQPPNVCPVVTRCGSMCPLDLVEVGHFLLRAGPLDATELEFQPFFKALSQLEKPVELVFQVSSDARKSCASSSEALDTHSLLDMPEENQPIDSSVNQFSVAEERDSNETEWARQLKSMNLNLDSPELDLHSPVKDLEDSGSSNHLSLALDSVIGTDSFILQNPLEDDMHGAGKPSVMTLLESPPMVRKAFDLQTATQPKLGEISTTSSYTTSDHSSDYNSSSDSDFEGLSSDEEDDDEVFDPANLEPEKQSHDHHGSPQDLGVLLRTPPNDDINEFVKSLEEGDPLASSSGNNDQFPGATFDLPWATSSNKETEEGLFSPNRGMLGDPSSQLSIKDKINFFTKQQQQAPTSRSLKKQPDASSVAETPSAPWALRPEAPVAASNKSSSGRLTRRRSDSRKDKSSLDLVKTKVARALPLLWGESKEAQRVKMRNTFERRRPTPGLPAIAEVKSSAAPVPKEMSKFQLKFKGRTRLRTGEIPDGSFFIIKWKHPASIGLTLRLVVLGKGSWPMVERVCRKSCCRSLQHIQVGDLLVEVNGKDTRLLGVRRTQEFLKTAKRAAQLRLRHGPLYCAQRIAS